MRTFLCSHRIKPANYVPNLGKLITNFDRPQIILGINVRMSLQLDEVRRLSNGKAGLPVVMEEEEEAQTDARSVHSSPAQSNQMQKSISSESAAADMRALKGSAPGQSPHG